ncbi:17012_t:CDS:2 [Cetraspora pellucida]|uniref:17012_t:CDS:1 n=1 Tax=Cetraspora pellucida TaxID=1433469 RepID=A0A9N9F0Z4_9GLOM|nr:17012_t:CDS:2 [Cetraspora pellucida]
MTEKGNDDTFDEFTYKDEELDKIDRYYIIKSSNNKIDLHNNPWKDKVSLAIYSTLVEKVPTQKEEEKTEPTMIKQLKKFVQTNTLNKKEKEKACIFIKEKSYLLTIGLDKLGTTSLITHYIDTGEARPIKQYFYKTFSDKQKFLDNKLESLERQGLIEKSKKHWINKKYSDANVFLQQHDSPEVSSNRIEVDSIENVELIAYHYNDKLNDKKDGKNNNIKLKEYIELRNDATESITTIEGNILGIQDGLMVNYTIYISTQLNSTIMP